MTRAEEMDRLLDSKYKKKKRRARQADLMATHRMNMIVNIQMIEDKLEGFEKRSFNVLSAMDAKDLEKEHYRMIGVWNKNFKCRG